VEKCREYSEQYPYIPLIHLQN